MSWVSELQGLGVGLTSSLCQGLVCGLNGHSGGVAHGGGGEVGEASLPTDPVTRWAPAIAERVLDHGLRGGGRGEG